MLARTTKRVASLSHTQAHTQHTVDSQAYGIVIFSKYSKVIKLQRESIFSLAKQSNRLDSSSANHFHETNKIQINTKKKRQNLKNRRIYASASCNTRFIFIFIFYRSRIRIVCSEWARKSVAGIEEIFFLSTIESPIFRASQKSVIRHKWKKHLGLVPVNLSVDSKCTSISLRR